MNIQETLDYLNSIEFISDVEKIDTSIKPNRGIVFLTRFKMLFQDTSEVFYIGFKDNFPLEKPIILLDNYNQFGFIPHIDPDGYVCYAHDEGLVLDYKNPKGIIEESIKLAILTLNNGISGNNVNDFYNEFDNYLAHYDYIKSGLLSCVEITTGIKKIDAFELNNVVVLCESKTKLKKHNFKGLVKNYTDSIKRINSFIFVHVDNPIMPHEFNKKWYRNELIDIINLSLADEYKAKLNQLMFKHNTTNLLVHFKAPNLSDCLVSFNIMNKGLERSSKQIEINVFPISRIDSSYVSQRGGALKSVENKKVLLIGCGSVGGFVAHNLVKSDVSMITLVDHDKFQIENTNRHILGIDSINKYKSEALKEFIENSTVNANISSFNNTIEKAIEEKSIQIQNYDLIISATGNPTVNLWLNDLVINTSNIPFVITWVEPYGIGGHSILVNNQKNGCYRCLMDETTNHNRAAFYAADQSFIKSLTSCSSVFTPYGILDALQSADGCVRLALTSLLREEEDNPIISWKGDSKALIDNGYQLSKRHEFSIEELYKARYSYKSKKCEICAKL